MRQNFENRIFTYVIFTGICWNIQISEFQFRFMSFCGYCFENDDIIDGSFAGINTEFLLPEAPAFKELIFDFRFFQRS
jgi:hypothetical protein